MRTFCNIVALGALLLATATSASAEMMLSFDNNNVTGGTISYDGLGGALTGIDIKFDGVMGSGTPDNDGVTLLIEDGLLNFATGSNISSSSTDWEFASGGSFTLTGTVKDGMTTVASGTLLTGTFTDKVEVTKLGTVLFALGVGTDSKNADLLAFYSIPASYIPNFVFTQTEFTAMNVTTGAGNSFSATVSEADITNTAVPEPSSLLLVTLGMFGMSGVALRRRRNCNYLAA